MHAAETGSTEWGAGASASTPVPNFFLVGAFKAGTTALYQYLRQHPSIYLSPRKEPAYFVSEFRAERLNPEWRRLDAADAPALREYLRNPHWGPQPRGPVTGWDDYLKLFRAAKPGMPIGEGSVGCLWSRTAASAIRERVPDARILMILRNPCDRAFSQYIAASRNVRESFSQAIRRSATAPPAPLFDSLEPFLDFGLYHDQVARYLSEFPSDRVRVFLYDDFATNPERVVRDVFRFLGVEEGIPLDLSERHNESRVPRFPGIDRSLTSASRVLGRSVPPALKRVLAPLRYRPRHSMRMSEDDRRFLVDYYSSDVRRLASLIDRDLSAWLA